MMKARLFTVSTFLVSMALLVLLVPGGAPRAAAQAQPAAPAPAPDRARVAEALRSSLVMFIENVGQFDDRARFQVRGATGGTMWLADDAIWLTVFEQRSEGAEEQGSGRGFSFAPLHPRTSAPLPRKGVNLKLSFVGANPRPRLEPFDRLDTVVSYFIGNDPAKWRPDVPVRGGVRYVDLYPGIDLVVGAGLAPAQGRPQGSPLPWRLEVRDGADVSAVRLRIEGAEAVELLAGGEGLCLATAVGERVLPLPALEGLSVEPAVERLGERAFEVTAPVGVGSISPAAMPAASSEQVTLVYSGFLGGSYSDYGDGIAVDRAGNAYVTGMTGSSDFPAVVGPDLSHNGYTDAFVAKVNAAGTGLAYAGFLGGWYYDGGDGIAVDGAGNAYVTGGTGYSDFPAVVGPDLSHNGGGDAFVAKVNAAGTGLVYAGFLGGSDHDYGFGIALDGAGNAHVTGETVSSDFPAVVGPDLSYNGGFYDAFVAKVNAAGTGLVYAGFLGGSDHDYGKGIAVDGAGNAYVTGTTGSRNFPAVVGPDLSFNRGGDAFVVKLAMGGGLGGVVIEARADIGMPYPDCGRDAQPWPCWRGCPSDYVGCGGPYHGFYLGVCTDLALDAYNAGVPFNLQDVLYQDHRAHPGRYHWGSARNAEDMRRYFSHNQQLLPHSQTYQPGDIAFFDWTGDGLSNHVGVISEVNANGRPLRMVHATGVCQVNPSGRAFEEAWSSYYDQHIQGHGRLAGMVSSAMATDETLQILRITVYSPSVALRLLDSNGKSTSSSYVEGLVALNNEAAIPYIPGGTYDELGTKKAITVTQPLSNASRYFVELTGQRAVIYSLHIETLQDSSVTESQIFTQTITSGETQGSQITLSTLGSTIGFTATSPTPSPMAEITDAMKLSGVIGTSAQATFTVAEVGGQQSLQNVVVSATDLMDQLGGIVSGAQLIITPDSFTVSTGSSQEVNIQIDLTNVALSVYRGALVLTSDNSGTHRVQLTLEVQFHSLYLPAIVRNH